jgi:hypothetical protein
MLPYASKSFKKVNLITNKINHGMGGRQSQAKLSTIEMGYEYELDEFDMGKAESIWIWRMGHDFETLCITYYDYDNN